MSLEEKTRKSPGRKSTAQHSKKVPTPVSREIRFERGDYFGLVFPSLHIRLVSNSQGRARELPAACDVCGRPIEDYPFIAKRHHSYRRYHLVCALEAGVVLPLKLDGDTAERVFDWLTNVTHVKNIKLYDVLA